MPECMQCSLRGQQEVRDKNNDTSEIVTFSKCPAYLIQETRTPYQE